MLRALPRDEALRRAHRAAHYPRHRASLRHVQRARSSSCRRPPGPVRMYFCGPTVYARAHIGNARPFVVGMWLRSWLRATGYDASSSTTSPTSTTRSTTPRRARAPSSPRARRSGTSRTRATSASGMPDHLPKATESVPQIVDVHRGADRVRARVPRAAATSTSASRASPSTGGSPASGPTRSSRAGAEPAQGGRPRLRALEGEQAGDRGHVVGVAVGPRPAGLAHRVLGDGRGDLRAGVRDPRRWARPRVPAPRERGGAVAVRSGIRSPRSGRTTGCSASPARRCRSRSATWRRCARRSTSGGARRCSSSSSRRHWRKPIDFSEETMAQAAARRGDAAQCVHAGAGRAIDERRWSAFAAALDDDFDTPRALAVLHDWASDAAARPAAARARRSSASSSLAEREQAPAEVAGARRAARAGACRAGFRGVGPPA